MSKRPWTTGISSVLRACAFLALAARLSAAPPAYGVLIVAPEGGKALSQCLADMAKRPAHEPPVRVAALSDTKSLQDAVAQLQKKRVAKIVAVPLLISSHESAMDHLRYLMGVRQAPAERYLSGLYQSVGSMKVQRLSFAVPVALSRALDDHPVVVEVLADRAAGLKPKAGSASLLVVAEGSAADLENSQWMGQVKMVAEAARRKAGFAEAEAFIWPENPDPKRRKDAALRLKRAAALLRRKGPVAVVAYALDGEGLGSEIALALKGTFVKRDGKGLLPDPRFRKWAQAREREAASLPDMRLFKDAGQPRPKKGRLGAPKEKA